MERSITTNQGKCLHCGLCVKDCMLSCLELGEGKIPQYKTGMRESCVGCQHCMAICPTGALSFGGLNPDHSEPVGYGSAEDLLRLIKSRRSVRYFRSDDIPQETLEKLREMLAYTPKGGNVDCLHFSIVGTRAKMEQIAQIAYAEAAKSTSPMMQFCTKRKNDGVDIIYRNAPSMLIAAIDLRKAIAGCETVDPIIALSYADLYAQSLCLGTLWDDCAVFAGKELPPVLEAYRIPAGYTLSFVLLLGKPAVKYQRTVQKPPDNSTII